jgi:hypothetical protein
MTTNQIILTTLFGIWGVLSIILAAELFGAMPMLAVLFAGSGLYLIYKQLTKLKPQVNVNKYKD